MTTQKGRWCSVLNNGQCQKNLFRNCSINTFLSFSQNIIQKNFKKVYDVDKKVLEILIGVI